MQLLADLLRGRADVAAHYRAAFPIGYGLSTWLFVPVALATNGVVAAKLATGIAVGALPLAHATLARALGRSLWTAALGAPFAFGLSYWYGFLPTLFALPCVLFAWAFFIRGALLAAAAFAVLTLLSHLVAFAALLVGLAALVVASPLPRRAFRSALAVAALPLALSAARIATLVGRAVNPGAHVPTTYDLSSHFNWIWKAHGFEGRADVALSVLPCLIVLAAGWLRRREEPRAPFVLFFAMAALYLATPKSVSGAWLIHVRLLVLVALAALLVVDVRALPRAVQATLAALALLSCSLTVWRHVRFAEAIRGLDEVTARAPPGVHGGMSLVGLSLPPDRVRALEHLAQWWTARHGGPGHHVFADADHQPLRFVEGAELPALLAPDSPPEAVAPFHDLVVYGDGALPANLTGFVERQRAGRWRRLERQ